jgi:FeS assembly SUF system protein
LIEDVAMTDRSTDRPDRPQDPVSPDADPAAANQAGPAPAVDPRDLEKKVVEVLQTCYDPEIPVNIYEMGLIYKVEVNPAGAVRIVMTLTSPMCPVAESLPPEVESKIWNVNGVTSARVEVVWDPPWTPDLMSEAAKLQLNMM